METPRETNGPEPIQTLLARLSTAWGVELLDPEQLARRHAERQVARLALGPAYADCTCLGAGGTGEELGLILERTAEGDPIVALVGDQVVYRWERICPCPDGEQHRRDIEAKRLVAAEQLRDRRVRKYLGEAGVHDVYYRWGLTTEAWAARAQEMGADALTVTATLAGLDAWRAAVAARSDQVTLLLAGNWGVGKSWLAAILVAEYASTLRSALYRRVAQVTDEIIDAPRWAPEDDDGTARTRARVLAAYQQAGLLALDDLGIEAMTSSTEQTVRSLIFELLEERMLSMRPTIVTTNLSRDVIARRYGERLADRLSSRMTHRLWLDVPNLREPRDET